MKESTYVKESIICNAIELIENPEENLGLSDKEIWKEETRAQCKYCNFNVPDETKDSL